jgi:hypothetical protein
MAMVEVMAELQVIHSLTMATALVVPEAVELVGIWAMAVMEEMQEMRMVVMEMEQLGKMDLVGAAVELAVVAMDLMVVVA